MTTNTATRAYIADSITNGVEMSPPLNAAITAACANPEDLAWLMDLIGDEIADILDPASRPTRQDR